MANTFELISSSTAGSGGVSAITFSSIPSTYTDLAIYYSLRDSDTSGGQVLFSFNGVSTNLSRIWLQGTGSTVNSSSNTNIAARIDSNDRTANTFGSGWFYCPNYTSSNYKSVSIDSAEENNATAALMTLTAGLWSSTAAITSITLTPGASPFREFSSAYLYGVKNA
jgi:hypothetical protein